MIARELFRQEAAKDEGLEARPEVQQALREAHTDILIQAWLKDHIKPATVTDEQVRAYYDTFVASLGDKEFQGRVIEVADDAGANAALARIRGGEEFGKVAHDVSLPPYNVIGGVTGWITFKVPAQEGQTGNLPLPVAQALSTLPPGAVSATAIAWNNRRFLVKVEEVRPTEVPPFEPIKASTRQFLQTQELRRATAALVSQLLGKAKVIQ